MIKKTLIVWKTTDRDGRTTHYGTNENGGMVNEEWLKENNLTLHQKVYDIHYENFGADDDGLAVCERQMCRNGHVMDCIGGGMYICECVRDNIDFLPKSIGDDIKEKSAGLQTALRELRVAREVMTVDCKCRDEDNLLTCDVGCECNCHKTNFELLELYNNRVVE